MTDFLHLITLVWTIQGGYIPHDNISTYVPFKGGTLVASLDQGDRAFADLAVEVDFTDYLFAKGSNLCTMQKIGGIEFQPMQETYTFGAGLKIPSIGLTAGWEHLCTHPVNSLETFTLSTQNDGGFFEGKDTFYIKLESKVKL